MLPPVAQRRGPPSARPVRQLGSRSGCEMRVDPFGNMYAIRAGRKPDLPVVLMGSHLDTQPHGGRFDGVLGVLAGLEVIRSLNDHGIETEHSVALANWTNEEGVRFKPGLTGSKGFIGALRVGDSSISGLDGADYFGELTRIGYSGTDTAPDLLGYLELHIEQGTILEAAGVPVGVVSGIQGVRWFEIEIHGFDAHAGTTAMQTRSDSFMAAAELAISLREIALRLSPDVRLTVGRVEVVPNSQNTVPGRTLLGVDLRHQDGAVLDAFEAAAEEAVSLVASNTRCGASIRRTMDVQPVRFNAEVVAALDAAVNDLKIPTMTLPSGAMHDASSIALHTPSAMIFVQSRDGISHNPAEWSEPDHVAMGCELLARAVLALAKSR
ncbi:M20 family metallo-hydrolase [Neoaquamicrobium sediminum]|uniref:M20 family metallo-hydrolase n=1 Tax=Neoaquamicrobium sediminum TaxID=1849104 RepID=UPI002457B484|nr:M20 family metallo-hydrolase [Mesorhizobium sediminum]